LDNLVKRGARQVIGQTIEAELAELLASCATVTTRHGKRAVVRDRSGSGIKFNSNIVPPYIRKSQRVSAALP
jgi:putative transposase